MYLRIFALSVIFFDFHLERHMQIDMYFLCELDWNWLRSLSEHAFWAARQFGQNIFERADYILFFIILFPRKLSYYFYIICYNRYQSIIWWYCSSCIGFALLIVFGVSFRYTFWPKEDALNFVNYTTGTEIPYHWAGLLKR